MQDELISSITSFAVGCDYQEYYIDTWVCTIYTYHLIWFKEQHAEIKCKHQQQSNLQKRFMNIRI